MTSPDPAATPPVAANRDPRAAAPSYTPTGSIGFIPPEPTRWGAGYITLVVLAQLAISIAQLAPSVYSLAVRVQTMTPADKDTMLAVVLTIPALVLIVFNPIMGILSDRTRSRLGRRRPWMIGGLAAGLIGLVIIGIAPNIPVVIVGWTIGYLGLTTTSSLVITHFGDALPESQRGKVSGINGAVTQIGPIAGVLLSGALVHMPFMLFFVPGVIAALGSIAFLIRMKDPSTKDVVFERINILGVFRRIVFNPRKHRDFAWVWISKAAMFVALYMMSIYTVYFLSERLHLSLTEVAGLTAVTSGSGILLTMLGALGGGFLSDRLRRRKVFVLISGVILAIGLVIIAFTGSTLQYVIGGLVFALGSGVFGACDQAIALDVLPDRQSPGRFLAINSLANEIPKAIAPVAAAVLVAVGAGSGYQLVYISAGVFALLSGLLVMPVKNVR